MIDIVINAVLIVLLAITISSLLWPRFYKMLVRYMTRLDVEQDAKGRSAEQSVAMVIIAAIIIYMLVVVNR